MNRKAEAEGGKSAGGSDPVPDVPLEKAWTIPSSWYFDREHYEGEKERIFARSWQAVGRIGQLSRPGAYFTADVGDEPILVVRGEDALVRAFSNVCRHRAGAVVRGEGCAPALRCTYHGWTYGLDGRLLATPEMEGVGEFDRLDFGLVPVRCETWQQYVFVNLDSRAPSLAQLAAPLAVHMDRSGPSGIPFMVRETYEIACNWKVYVDNYLEGYHIPRAHHGLNKVLDYALYEVRPEGNAIVQIAPYREDRDKSSVYLWLFPNFMINLSGDYIQTNVVVPLGPERTLTIFDYFFGETARGVGEEARRAAMAFSDEIQREDILLCETVQRNLHSRSYEAGRYCARRENGLYHFHRLLRAALA